jgi:hypothetical protein
MTRSFFKMGWAKSISFRGCEAKTAIARSFYTNIQLGVVKIGC